MVRRRHVADLFERRGFVKGRARVQQDFVGDFCAEVEEFWLVGEMR